MCISANTWDDIIHPDGSPLFIGKVNIPASKHKDGSAAPFVGGEDSPPPREVKSALVLSLQLLLLPNNDNKHDRLTDTAMYNVANRVDTKGVNASVCTKANQEMLQDLIDFVAYNLAFNEFTNRSKYECEDCYVFDDDNQRQNFRNADMFIAHNREAIIHFLKQVDSAAYELICPWKTDSNNKPKSPRHLDQIMQRRHTVIRKYTVMGVKPHHLPPPSAPTVKKEVPHMWIHHFFLLHNVLLVLHQCLYNGVEESLRFHDDWRNFMSTVHVKYGNTSTKFRNIVVWMGTDCRPRG
jgi:hypothetical protein